MSATEPHIGKVKAPVCIVHAKNDLLVPFGHVEYAKQHFTDINIIAPDKAGHRLPTDHPDMVLDAIQSFDNNQEIAA